MIAYGISGDWAKMNLLTGVTSFTPDKHGLG